MRYMNDKGKMVDLYWDAFEGDRVHLSLRSRFLCSENKYLELGHSVGSEHRVIVFKRNCRECKWRINCVKYLGKTH